ncbi:MAG: diacylglycerol/lipid kinase family protein [Bacteriovoracia bacterium]
MAHISVYLNPQASASQHQFQVDEIQKYFFRQDIRFRTPSSMEELVQQIKLDKEGGVDCIFSIGGDGTAHIIAQNLVGHKTKLLVLPGGTANDLAHELGTNSNLRKLASIFHARTTREVDVIKVNDRYLITNGGIGIAHRVAQDINKLRKEISGFKNVLKFVGKNAYSAMFIKQTLLTKFHLLDIYLDSPDCPLLEKKIRSPLILVNNQPRLAGKFPVAPFTRNDDGKFNVTIFLHDNRFDFIKTASSFLLGKYPENDKKLISFETDSLKMMSLGQEDLNFFGDGENFTPAKELDISLVPRSLVVYSRNEDIVLCPSHSLDTIPTIQ